MPELPDLQVFASNLDNTLAGKKVEQLSLKNKSRVKTTEKKFKQAIEHARLKKIYREGKELHFLFNNNTVLGLHLMLHGRLHLVDHKEAVKYSILELFFNKDEKLVLAD